MNKISFTIYGEPIALKRHRTTTIKAKDGRMFNMEYDPSKKDKKNLLYASLEQHRPDKPIESPIELNVIFYMLRPKNHYGTGKNATKLKESSPIWHTKRPDVDNFLKLIFDAFNNTYWRDDSQICKLTAMKMYTNMQPRTEIEIIELN